MAAAQGANQFASTAASGDPRYNAAGYWDPFGTTYAGGGPRPAGQNAIAPAAATAAAAAPAAAPVAAVAAAPIARTPTPQETLNQQYVPQLNAQMQKDPSNGYADQLKTLMNGQFSTSDPSYQWRYDQGQKAVERSVAARGLLNSGNAALELQQYGQGAASQEYGAQFNRTLSAMGASESAFQSSYNRLAELAGMTSGMQANSQNTNYNYASLAERAQNNAAQIGIAQGQLGLGYAQLAQRGVTDAANISLGRDQLAVNANTAAQEMGLRQNQQQFNQQTANNRDEAFRSVVGNRSIGSGGVGATGYDSWGNPAGGNFVSVGTADSDYSPSIYGGMSGYY